MLALSKRVPPGNSGTGCRRRFAGPAAHQAFAPRSPAQPCFRSGVPLPPDPMTRETRWSVTALK